MYGIMNLFVPFSLPSPRFLKLVKWSLFDTKTHKKNESLFIPLPLNKKSRKSKQFFLVIWTVSELRMWTCEVDFDLSGYCSSHFFYTENKYSFSISIPS